MPNRSATDAEKLQVMETMLRIWHHIPASYGSMVMAECERQGIQRTRKQVYRARNLEAFDLQVVQILESISRPHRKSKPVPSAEEYRTKMAVSGL